jgi:carbamoyl-phosphate synthase large subunit
LLKAVRSLETKSFGLFSEEMEKLSDEVLEAKCRKPEDNLLFVMAEGFRRGWPVSKISALNQWNPYISKEN